MKRLYNDGLYQSALPTLINPGTIVAATADIFVIQRSAHGVGRLKKTRKPDVALAYQEARIAATG